MDEINDNAANNYFVLVCDLTDNDIGALDHVHQNNLKSSSQKSKIKYTSENKKDNCIFVLGVFIAVGKSAVKRLTIETKLCMSSGFLLFVS